MKALSIKFKKDTVVGVVSRKGKYKGMDRIEKGYDTMALVSNAHVEEVGNDLIETADLELPNGNTLVDVPYGNFRFN